MAIYKKQRKLGEKNWEYNSKNFEFQVGMVTVRHKVADYIDLPCTVENPVKVYLRPIQVATNTITRLRLNAGYALGTSALPEGTNESVETRSIACKVTANTASKSLLLSKTAMKRKKGEIFIYGGKLYEFTRDLSAAATYGASQGGVTKGLTSTYSTIKELKEFNESGAKSFIRIYCPYTTSAAATDSALRLHLAYEVTGFKP